MMRGMAGDCISNTLQSHIQYYSILLVSIIHDCWWDLDLDLYNLHLTHEGLNHQFVAIMPKCVCFISHRKALSIMESLCMNIHVLAWLFINRVFKCDEILKFITTPSVTSFTPSCKASCWSYHWHVKSLPHVYKALLAELISLTLTLKSPQIT